MKARRYYDGFQMPSSRREGMECPSCEVGTMRWVEFNPVHSLWDEKCKMCMYCGFIDESTRRRIRRGEDED